MRVNSKIFDCLPWRGRDSNSQPPNDGQGQYFCVPPTNEARIPLDQLSEGSTPIQGTPSSTPRRNNTNTHQYERLPSSNPSSLGHTADTPWTLGLSEEDSLTLQTFCKKNELAPLPENLGFDHIIALNTIEQKAHETEDSNVCLVAKTYKLQILNECEARLTIRLGQTPPNYELPPKKSTWQQVKSFMVGSFMFMGGVVGNVLGLEGTLYIFPFLANSFTFPIVIVVALAFTLVEGWVLSSSGVSFLERALGMDDRSDLMKFLELDAIELNAIKRIQMKSNQIKLWENQRTPESLGVDDVSAGFDTLCKDLLTSKKQLYEVEKPTTWTETIVRHALTLAGVGALGYFTFSGLFYILEFFAPAFAFTPAGLVILAVCIAITIAAFCKARTKASEQEYSAEMRRFKDLKKNIKLWIDTVAFNPPAPG